jgi:chromosome transmission fidelity protein 18
VSDVIPYGLWLLSAGDGKHALSKPVSSVDILSVEEKLAFSAHVQTLRDLGLTYVKDGGAFDYNYTKNLRLEPEIDKLVKFEFLEDSVGRKEIPALLKELLAHGATVAALRERESEALLAQQAVAAREIDRPSKPKEDVFLPKADEKPPAVTPKKGHDNPVSNTSAAKNFLGFRAAKAKEAKSARRAATVGFDRSKTMKLSNTGSGVEISKVIRFKYQKGFTQAVRAPCQMDDLL